MEAVGAGYVERIRIKPTPLGSVGFDGWTARAQEGDELRVSISLAGTELAHGSTKLQLGRGGLELSVARPELWSPENPKLYDATLELVRNNQVLDRVKSYFGFRTVEARDGRVYLNGKPIYLKFVL